MAEKLATREAYGNALVELAEKYDFVVLDADLAGVPPQLEGIPGREVPQPVVLILYGHFLVDVSQVEDVFAADGEPFPEGDGTADEEFVHAAATG